MSLCTTGILHNQLHGAKPLAVSVRVACNLLGVGNTTMWGLIKSDRVKTIRIGRRRLIIYASLEALLPCEAREE
jgi:excisionase family DNA binding protein